MPDLARFPPNGLKARNWAAFPSGRAALLFYPPLHLQGRGAAAGGGGEPWLKNPSTSYAGPPPREISGRI